MICGGFEAATGPGQVACHELLPASGGECAGEVRDLGQMEGSGRLAAVQVSDGPA